MPHSLSKPASPTSSRQNERWETNSFHCSAEWHIAAIDSRLAGVLHSWGLKLSLASESFYPSVGNIAKYFRRDRTTVLRALGALKRHGWVEIKQREPGKPVVYRFFTHDEWLERNPGHCVVRDVMPWDGQHDQLAVALHAASGGRVKFLPGQMTGLLKFGLREDEIDAEFRRYLQANPPRGLEWNRLYYKFHAYLSDVRARASGPKSSGEVSRPRDTHQSRQSDTPVASKRHPLVAPTRHPPVA